MKDAIDLSRQVDFLTDLGEIDYSVYSQATGNHTRSYKNDHYLDDEFGVSADDPNYEIDTDQKIEALAKILEESSCPVSFSTKISKLVEKFSLLKQTMTVKNVCHVFGTHMEYYQAMAGVLVENNIPKKYVVARAFDREYVFEGTEDEVLKLLKRPKPVNHTGPAKKTLLKSAVRYMKFFPSPHKLDFADLGIWKRYQEPDFFKDKKRHEIVGFINFMYHVSKGKVSVDLLKEAEKLIQIEQIHSL